MIAGKVSVVHANGAEHFFKGREREPVGTQTMQTPPSIGVLQELEAAEAWSKTLDIAKGTPPILAGCLLP